MFTRGSGLGRLEIPKRVIRQKITIAGIHNIRIAIRLKRKPVFRDWPIRVEKRQRPLHQRPDVFNCIIVWHCIRRGLGRHSSHWIPEPDIERTGLAGTNDRLMLSVHFEDIAPGPL